MVKSPTWRIKDLVDLIVISLLTKFDFFIIIDGNRGLGKSTLAYHISRLVAQRFRTIKSKVGMTRTAYTFVPERDLVYTQEEVLGALTQNKSIIVGDEAINTAFSRDFFQQHQKNLIKTMAMFRDQNNLTIFCVPKFSSLDYQIRSLCKMRITVVRRGVAIVQTKNQSIYSSDPWESSVNEKIEKKWAEHNVNRPKYSKLTTFRGFLRFPALTPGQEARYQKVKDDKRNIILKEEMKLKEEEKNKPFERLMERLLDGGIKNRHVIEGFAVSEGIEYTSLREKIRKRLKNTGREPKLEEYFWEGGSNPKNLMKKKQFKSKLGIN